MTDLHFQFKHGIIKAKLHPSLEKTSKSNKKTVRKSMNNFHFSLKPLGSKVDVMAAKIIRDAIGIGRCHAGRNGMKIPPKEQ